MGLTIITKISFKINVGIWSIPMEYLLIKLKIQVSTSCALAGNKNIKSLTKLFRVDWCVCSVLISLLFETPAKYVFNSLAIWIGYNKIGFLL